MQPCKDRTTDIAQPGKSPSLPIRERHEVDVKFGDFIRQRFTFQRNPHRNGRFARIGGEHAATNRKRPSSPLSQSKIRPQNHSKYFLKGFVSNSTTSKPNFGRGERSRTFFRLAAMFAFNTRTLSILKVRFTVRLENTPLKPTSKALQYGTFPDGFF